MYICDDLFNKFLLISTVIYRNAARNEKKIATLEATTAHSRIILLILNKKLVKDYG